MVSMTSIFSYHLPTTGRSPDCPKGPRQPSTWQPSNIPLLLRSRSHRPVLGSKTPIFAVPEPVQSPTTGRSPEIPKGPRQPSIGQVSNVPSLFRSSFHRPVLGVKTPILGIPEPVQSPTTGKSLERPKGPRQPSIGQVSNVPSLFRSSFQRPFLGR